MCFNLDSSNVGPKQWVALARMLDTHRDQYDAFVVVHGTDTLAYTASALSLMLAGFRRAGWVAGGEACAASGWRALGSACPLERWLCPLAHPAPQD